MCIYRGERFNLNFVAGRVSYWLTERVWCTGGAQVVHIVRNSPTRSAEVSRVEVATQVALFKWLVYQDKFAEMQCRREL